MSGDAVAQAQVNYLRAAAQVKPSVMSLTEVLTVDLAQQSLTYGRALSSETREALMALTARVGSDLGPESTTEWSHRGWRIVTTGPDGETVVRVGRIDGFVT